MLKSLLSFAFLLSILFTAHSQVSSVEYGKNRVQYKKFKWKFYQTDNFNVHFIEGGEALGKMAAKSAEEILPGLEEFVEYGLQRRANIIVYNSFTDYRQSNIGIGIDWQNTGGVTKLVNNKMIIYFDGNLQNLEKQIKQGVAQILVENLLFGDDLGEFATNQTLLDLPRWLTEGYIRYAAETWSTTLDDKLKSALLSGSYKSFYQFAFKEPELAGHAFWKFIEDKYRRDNTTYFLYLARIYKSLNAASLKITKKKFKELLEEFMQVESEKYYADLRGRRNQPKGTVVAVEEASNGRDYYRFQVNPIPRNNSYAVVEYQKGIYRVVYEDLSIERKTLLKAGILNNQDELNPNYPIMAWDPKGSKLLVIYTDQGKIKMFVYDIPSKIKTNKQELPEFQLIQDAKFMLDNNTLILSAVKNGQSDIFVYKIKEQSIQQITNDPYDDMDGSFVSFPGKTGIIFSSNRPSPNASKADSVLPTRYPHNIFLVDNWNKSEFRQITQLTNQQLGQARYPLQYNVNHFTFVSDANGIGNRYAGFFKTQRAGIDTLYKIGEDVLRNPDWDELDSTLKAWKKSEPDSIGYMSITNDSTYTFPITNYQSSLLETRGAGDNNLVSEVRQEGELRFLYKLKINESVLNKRNVNARPTAYIREVLEKQRKQKSDPIKYFKPTTGSDSIIDTNPKRFQTEFADEIQDSKLVNQEQDVLVPAKDVIKNAKLYDYKRRFASDYVVSGFNNSILVNRYQPYGGGSGPIFLSNNNPLNGIVRMGISDIMEDMKFTGGFRIATNLKDNDYLASFQNLKKRYDWGLTYYRSNQEDYPIFDQTDIKSYLQNKLASNLYQLNISYPFNEVKSVRAIIGYRSDRVIIKSDANYDPTRLMPDTQLKYALVKFEYVHDNTINPTMNIYNGLRYKVFTDINANMAKSNSTGKFMFNIGADARYYYPIYRNFIWAGRAAADFSFGTQKLIYYLGGVEGWLNPKFNFGVPPAPDQNYAFQTLALNLRGHKQNIANGNNNVVLNSEFRLPVFATLLNRPINNAFIRNLQLVQFIDMGTAWNGRFTKIGRPSATYGSPPIQVNIKTGGIGPFVGGYGFGLRSTVLGYFLRVDSGWPMGGFFKGKPIWYFSLGLDF
jgi:hypothetical protein